MRRMFRVAGCLAASWSLVGCYTLQPTGGAVPQLGEEIAFDVNDVGRAALGGSMGPEIGQIEGKLLQKDTTQYVVSVSTVRFLRGGEQPWSGETVKIKPEYVTTTYAKHFSQGRTIALSAVGVGALAFLVTRSLIGSGATEPKTPTDTASASISPRP